MHLVQELSRVCRNIWIDLRYGGMPLSGSLRTNFGHLGAYDTVNISYVELPRMFRDLPRSNDVIVDVGCGKGRLFNWLLSCHHSNRMIGIELDPEVAESCRRRLRRFRNIEIVTGNILEKMPDEGTLFYLYNPFNEAVMRQFADSLKASYGRSNRDMTVIYYFCWAARVFENDPFWTVEHLQTGLARLRP